MSNQSNLTPLDPDIMNEINELLDMFLKDEKINKLKLSESFAYSYYTNQKFCKPSRVMNFQISDENFLFSVNINLDNNGDIILFNIKKETPIM